MPRIGYEKKKLIEEHTKKLGDIFKVTNSEEKSGVSYTCATAQKTIDEDLNKSEVINSYLTSATRTRIDEGFDFSDSKGHPEDKIEEMEKVMNDHISELLHRFERELQIGNAEDDIFKIFDIIKDRGKSIEEIKLVIQKFSELYETEFWIEIYQKGHYHLNYDSVFPIDDFDMLDLIVKYSDNDIEMKMSINDTTHLHIILNTEEELAKFKEIIEKIKEEVKENV